MRIASLVPSATEMLFALGLGDQVVAVTHECDYPPEAAAKRHLTRSLVPEGLSAGEIDAEVRRLTGEGKHLYELDEPALAELEVDLIVTQALCEVCAVSYDDVVAVAARLESRPRVISLDPDDLGEVLDDIDRLGETTGAGDRAAELRTGLERRLADVRAATAGARPPACAAARVARPAVHRRSLGAGDDRDRGGRAAALRPRRQVPDRELGGDRRRRADVVVAMPCGWDAKRARIEVESHSGEIGATGAERIWAVDGAASFSRPGPRLVDGVELLAHLLHPDRVREPSGVPFERVEEKTWA